MSIPGIYVDQPKINQFLNLTGINVTVCQIFVFHLLITADVVWCCYDAADSVRCRYSSAHSTT